MNIYFTIYKKHYFKIIKTIKSLYLYSKSYVMKSNYDKIEYYISSKKRLIYIVNSKAACSAIKYSLIKTDGIIVDNEYYTTIHKTAKNSGNIRDKLSKREKEYFIFSFVRNPFERLVSLYINKFLDQDKIRRTGFEYENYLGGILNRDMSFQDFVNIICQIPDHLSDKHFKSQYYLLYTENRKVDYVGHIENLENDFKILSDKYNLSGVKIINKSNKYDYTKYYDQELTEIVYKRYQKDVDYFGYKEIYSSLLAK